MDPSTLIWDDTGARRITLHEMLITVDMGKANRSSSIGFEFDPSRFRSKMDFLKRIIKWVVLEKLYSSHGIPHHLSTILLKDSHLFKIVESVISFYFFFKLTQQF